MKATFFRTSANLKPVFGILEPISTLQMQIQAREKKKIEFLFGKNWILFSFHLFFFNQNLHAEVFDEFNRIDTEISFGAALAKATDDISRATNLEGTDSFFLRFFFFFSFFGGLFSANESRSFDNVFSHFIFSNMF